MLRDRWASLLTAMGGWDDGWEIYEAVVGAYGSGGRFYHGLDHLRRCLADLDEAIPLSRPPVLEFAVWLHDLVCEPGSAANEAVSAAAAHRFALRLGARKAFADRAAAMILATRHDRPPGDEATALLLDVDLAVLADPWPAFAAYEAGIRREYSFAPASVYVRGRRAFLRALLARERIYYTDGFRARCEGPARRNLERLTASL